MRNDEFAFFNQQLAGMLRDGIPLEGALRKLCQEMRRGPLRSELELLEGDLSRGVPLKDAVNARKLPELYQKMLMVGVQSNDLPAVLILLGDYYQRRHSLWTRLTGLMVYPAIVLVSTFLVSCFMALLLAFCIGPNLVSLAERRPILYDLNIWVPPIMFGLAVILFAIFVGVPAGRRFLRWRLPAFRESSLVQIASAMALMLKNGVPLDDALALVEHMERGTAAGEELARWRRELASGRGKFSEMAAPGKAFPPLFIWLVAQSGNDLGEGFRRAAEIYQGRTTYRADLLLYSALPCSVLVLGLILMSQLMPVFSTMTQFLKSVGDQLE